MTWQCCEGSAATAEASGTSSRAVLSSWCLPLLLLLQISCSIAWRSKQE